MLDRGIDAQYTDIRLAILTHELHIEIAAKVNICFEFLAVSFLKMNKIQQKQHIIHITQYRMRARRRQRQGATDENRDRQGYIAKKIIIIN